MKDDALLTEFGRLMRGRRLSPAAMKEAVRLIADGTVEEVADTVRHLRHLSVVDEAAIDVCPETTALLDERLRRRHGRQVAHIRRMRQTARAIGGELATYQLTFAEAQRRLALLCAELDSELDIDVRLVPAVVAERVTSRSFNSAFKAGKDLIDGA